MSHCYIPFLLLPYLCCNIELLLHFKPISLSVTFIRATLNDFARPTVLIQWFYVGTALVDTFCKIGETEWQLLSPTTFLTISQYFYAIYEMNCIFHEFATLALQRHKALASLTHLSWSTDKHRTSSTLCFSSVQLSPAFVVRVRIDSLGALSPMPLNHHVFERLASQLSPPLVCDNFGTGRTKFSSTTKLLVDPNTECVPHQKKFCQSLY